MFNNPEKIYSLRIKFHKQGLRFYKMAEWRLQKMAKEWSRIRNSAPYWLGSVRQDDKGYARAG